ncbi:unnamed protein product [Peronospora destructor]|uniref:PAP-associated domain-containing protein n=1 Tax=Peronospora destructor TaxID=86335 RepID=A0AAV0UC97_9STRA|nr:unnamed protein product [Peronospora destructor]
MNASVSEVVTASPRHQPHLHNAHQNKKVLHEMESQYVSLQDKQKLQKAHLKSTSKLPASNVDTATPVGDYRDALWFKEGEGDLFFAQWLLVRCNGVGDVMTPQFVDATKRIFALFKIQRKLREELALSSKREVPEDVDDPEEEEHEVDIKKPLWLVEEIVEQVGAVLTASRLKQQKAKEKANTNLEGALERIVVAEVVENATELILSRATSDHKQLLRRWIEILKEDETEGDKMGANLLEINFKMHRDVEETTAQKSKKKCEKTMQLRKNKSREAKETACKQVESFLTFLMESAQTQTLDEASVAELPLVAKKMWSTELQQIMELSSIEPEEEERRLRVARDIQTVLQREVSKWRDCKVILFGSSVSHYGSRSSDLDMCLLPNGRNTGKYADPPQEGVGRRQLQRLIENNLGENGHEPSTNTGLAEQLRGLHAQVQTSIEKLAQALNTLDRSSKKDGKTSKQRSQLEFFNTQMRLLRDAIVAELTKVLGVQEPFDVAYSNGKSAHLKATIAASRRRSDDLYLLRAILQRAAKCEVRHVIAGARVPIIRFLHTHSGRDYECDLCFENVLATRNTPLLRAYACFDDRARTLGLAVKHWAKQRGINDASIGCLSSYSFVLLCIFYLQVVQVLPNLQNPGLLEYARIQPVYYNDINIAFCEDRGLAQAYHQPTSARDPSDMSLATLLAGFFEFYATHFDFAKRVVTVRSPETPALKLQQWGSRKAKTWRMSIEDPLETTRDLGCVLHFKGQERIICEFRRAHKMLIQGKSFSEEVCAVKKPADRLEKAKQMKEDVLSAKRVQSIPNQQQADKVRRSYMLTLRSADEELTKETIELFFKGFQKSFRVGKVVEATTLDSTTDENDDSGNKNKRWEVELLTQAEKCPRSLSLRTRIDWKASDGREGRVWLHHQALFATPPCQKCLSPEHPTSKCLLEDVDENDNDESAAAGDRGEPCIDHKAQKNIHRHVLRLTLGGNSFATISQRNDRRKKQQQHPMGKKTKPNTKRSMNRTGKTELCGVKKTETEPLNGRHVEVVASPSLTSRGEGDIPGKATRKKKKWQQQVHRKRGNSKGNKNNAVLNSL